MFCSYGSKTFKTEPHFVIGIMLRVCNSVCCCFSCNEKETLETKEVDANFPTTVSDKLNNGPINDAEGDVKVICEANLEHILKDQKQSDNIYKFQLSKESLSLHESIIEEEELNNVEVCESIVYMVDGQPSSLKDFGDDSESEYSSDITIINVSIEKPSSLLLETDSVSSLQDIEPISIIKETSYSLKESERYNGGHKNSTGTAVLGDQQDPYIATMARNSPKTDIMNEERECKQGKSFSTNKSLKCSEKAVYF